MGRLTDSMPGLTIASAPRKPTAVAVHRAASTLSRSTSPAASVQNTGIRKDKAVTSPTGMWMSP